MSKCRRCNIELIKGVNSARDFYVRRGKAGGLPYCITCHRKEARRHAVRTNKTQMYVNGKYISKTHPLYKAGRYKTFSDAAFDGTYKLDSIKEGYVYAITNPAWSEWVKIGMAVDADDRCNGYQTSSPFRDYKLEHTVVTNNRRKAEAKAHIAASKIAEEQRGEWFKISIEQAKDILNKLSVNLEKAA